MVGSTLDPEMAGLMRVSVVATGIDAAARSEAMPLPKRTIAEPVAAPAASGASAPAPARPCAEPRAPSRPAPSFADHQRRRGRAGRALRRAAGRGAAAGGRWSAPRPSASRSSSGGEPRRPGEPSPDALRRLQAAVQNVPKAQPMVRPVAPQPPREAERHSRLTINSLIHKMTGQVGREQQAPCARGRRSPSSSRARPQVADAGYEESERERVDIPAFLRRQAN